MDWRALLVHGALLLAAFSLIAGLLCGATYVGWRWFWDDFMGYGRRNE